MWMYPLHQKGNGLTAYEASICLCYDYPRTVVAWGSPMENQALKIYDQAMALEPVQRVLLAETLLNSTTPAEQREDVEVWWKDEISRRLASRRRGESQSIPFDQAMAKLEAMIET